MPLPRTLVIPFALGAVALAVYAGWTLLEMGEYDALAEEAYLGADGEAVDAREEAVERRERLAALARGATRPPVASLDDDDDEGDAIDPPAVDPSGPVGKDEAEVGFDYAMRRVEKTAGKRKRLKLTAWEALYREANDAFSAYSMHLDASDPDQLTLLEDARRRLIAGLGRVRVRGGKKLAY